MSPLGQEEVPGDRQEVALDRCQVDTTARVPQADEGLRKDVVRQGRIAREEQHEPVHVARMRPVQLREIDHVPLRSRSLCVLDDVRGTPQLVTAGSRTLDSGIDKTSGARVTFPHMPRSVFAVSLLSLLIGVVAGLRTMTALAAVSWAAYLGWLDLSGSWLVFLGYAWTPWILSAFALIEFVTDQLPSTPSRRVPVQFGARIVSGALAGAAIGRRAEPCWPAQPPGSSARSSARSGGARHERRLAKAFGSDPPAAFIEDVVALLGALLIVVALR